MRHVVFFRVALDRQNLDGRVQQFAVEFVESRELVGVLVYLLDGHLSRGNDEIGSILEDAPRGTASNGREQHVAIRDDAS